MPTLCPFSLSLFSFFHGWGFVQVAIAFPQINFLKKLLAEFLYCKYSVLQCKIVACHDIAAGTHIKSLLYICSSVVAQHVDSQRKGYEFKSYMCHSKITIGEEGDWKPTRKIHFPRNTQNPVSSFVTLELSKLRSLFKLNSCFYFQLKLY